MEFSVVLLIWLKFLPAKLGEQGKVRKGKTAIRYATNPRFLASSQEAGRHFTRPLPQCSHDDLTPSPTSGRFVPVPSPSAPSVPFFSFPVAQNLTIIHKSAPSAKNASHEDRKRSLRLAEGLERSKPHPLLLDVLSVSLFRKMGVCCGEWLCKTVLKLFSLSGCFCW